MALESFLEEWSFELGLSQEENSSRGQGAFTVGETEQLTEASCTLVNTPDLMEWRVSTER